MSYGKDERDIAKHIWELSIPRFDLTNAVHIRLSELARNLELWVAALELTTERHFASVRGDVRDALEQNPDSVEADELVRELIS